VGEGGRGQGKGEGGGTGGEKGKDGQETASDETATGPEKANVVF
jgi:hypothetical protein